MDQLTQAILKGNNYVGPAQRLKPYIHRLPGLNELHLTTVNTVTTCRVCRGKRVIINHHSNGLMDYEPCPACGKTGIMDPRKLEVRR